MSNEHLGQSAHSAQYFGDTRDHWWNIDFLQMIAARWNVAADAHVLDVGCGVGHWGRTLAMVVPPTVRVTGIDRETLWVDKATENARAMGLGDRFRYQQATAQALPFADGTFDVVTCQTVLMHLPDPAAALREMVRVAKRGALIVCAEPTNFMGSVVNDAAVLGTPPQETARLVAFQLMCLHGKKACGEGDDLLGERLPLLMHQAGIADVQLRMNDKPYAMVPPYASAAERASADEILEEAERGLWIWDRAKTERYFVAGGGAAAAFAGEWDAAIAERRRVAAAVKARTYSVAGGGLFYLAWGHTPA